jgi:hypothetical protein
MGRKRKYSLNENYFSEINSINKHYILGFIYADGSVYKNYLSITVQICDISVLEFIKKELNYGGPIYIKSTYCTLTISSKKLVDDLFLLDIIQNKTYESKNLPLFNIEYFPQFILGFFDGDGSIYKSSKTKLYEYTLNFTSNKIVLDEIKNLLKERLISSSNIRKRYDNEISCMLDIKGSINLEKMYNLFYSNPPEYFFKRKHNKFIEFINSLKNINNRNFSNKIILEIKQMYLDGIKQSDISKKLNLKASSVRCVIQRLRKKNKIY